MHEKPSSSTSAETSESEEVQRSGTELSAQPRAARVSDVLPPGTQAGEYVIDALIGRGGMGAVYAARQPLIGKRVAVKVLSARGAQPTLVQRFIDEARAVNRIGHRNIVDIFGFGQLADGRNYYVMELLRGQSLRERLNAGQPTAAEIELYLTQLCAALQAAHNAGIVHRDLKPENIWISSAHHDQPQLKLLDFGIAKFFETGIERREALTAVGAALGTPAYMSPEQCSGEPLDARTDIYALGIMLFEIYMDSLPFDGNAMQLLAQHLTMPPPAATRAPAAVARLIADCLAKDRAQRPQDIAELMARMCEAAGWVLGQQDTLPSQPPARRNPAQLSDAGEIIVSSGLQPSAAAQPGRARRTLLIGLLVAATFAASAWRMLSQPAASPALTPHAESPAAMPGPETSLKASSDPLPALHDEAPAGALPAGVAPPAPAAKAADSARQPKRALPPSADRPTSNAERRGLATSNPFR